MNIKHRNRGRRATPFACDLGLGTPEWLSQHVKVIPIWIQDGRPSHWLGTPGDEEECDEGVLQVRRGLPPAYEGFGSARVPGQNLP